MYQFHYEWHLVFVCCEVAKASLIRPIELKSLLSNALEEDRVQTCGVITAELLQGCRHPKEQRFFQNHLGSLHYLEWPESDWTDLGEASSKLRSQGVTVPLMDLMIAHLAIKNASTVLHRDHHFELIAKHLPVRQEKV